MGLGPGVRPGGGREVRPGGGRRLGGARLCECSGWGRHGQVRVGRLAGEDRMGGRGWTGEDRAGAGHFWFGQGGGEVGGVHGGGGQGMGA